MTAGFYGRTFGSDAKIPLEKFGLWEKRALAEINCILARKLPEDDDENAKMCICEVAEFLYENEKRNCIQSENTDGYSVRFETVDKKKELFGIIKKWFSGSELLYRGDVL